MTRVAVLCWEESRPWVSTLRQEGYSVPWVDEPKGDVGRQASGGEPPDVLVVDLTRLPEQDVSILSALASSGPMAGTPVVAVTSDGRSQDGLGDYAADLVTFTGPDGMIGAVQSALAERQEA